MIEIPEDLAALFHERAAAVPPPNSLVESVGRRHRRHVRQTRVLAVVTATVLVGGAAVGTSLLAGDRSTSLPPLDEPRPIVSGASAPSPYPNEPNTGPYPRLCESEPKTDAAGYLQAPMSFFSTNVIEPPGAIVSRFTRAEAIAKFPHGFEDQGHPRAVFALVTSVRAHRQPMWVTFVCDGAYIPSSGGPLIIGPQPAPGTSPSPLGQRIGVVVAPIDEQGRNQDGIYQTGIDSPQQLAQRFVSVPWTRTHDDHMGGRQIGIAYEAAEPCATFDHLDVSEVENGAVHVRVWLRVNPDGPDHCASDKQHHAVVGLRKPLGNRPFLDAS